MINYEVFVNKIHSIVKKFYSNNALILAIIHLLVSERAGLLEQKIEWLPAVTVTLHDKQWFN